MQLNIFSYLCTVKTNNAENLGSKRRVSASGAFVNEGVNEFNGLIGVAIVNVESGDSTMNKCQRATLQPYLNGRTYSQTLTFTGTRIQKEGTYRVFLASKDDSENAWQPIRKNENGANMSMLITVKYEDNNYKITSAVSESNDNWTKIQSLNNDHKINTTADIYNIAGQRVGESYKGIVIRNGRKIAKR